MLAVLLLDWVGGGGGGGKGGKRLVPLLLAGIVCWVGTTRGQLVKEHATLFGTNGRHTEFGWKKVFPVAGAGRGHSSTTLGPWFLRRIPSCHPPLF